MVRLVEVLTRARWLVGGTVVPFVPIMAIEGVRWWTVGPLVLGVVAFLDLLYLRQRFAKRIAKPSY